MNRPRIDIQLKNCTLNVDLHTIYRFVLDYPDIKLINMEKEEFIKMYIMECL